MRYANITTIFTLLFVVWIAPQVLAQDCMNYQFPTQGNIMHNIRTISTFRIGGPNGCFPDGFTVHIFSDLGDLNWTGMFYSNTEPICGMDYYFIRAVFTNHVTGAEGTWNCSCNSAGCTCYLDVFHADLYNEPYSLASAMTQAMPTGYLTLEFPQTLAGACGRLTLCVAYHDTTPTPTPPPPTPPAVTMAGYWDSDVSEANGGYVRMVALVSEESYPIHSVEVFLLGEPTGVYLYDDSLHDDFDNGDYIFGMGGPINPGMPKMQVLHEIKVTDVLGNSSILWPYMIVE